MNSASKTYDVAIIGYGLAGMAAVLFAARRGLTAVICGATGGIDLGSGLIDLMEVHPVEQGRTWDDPWEAISALLKDHPEHPYGFLPRAEIEKSLAEFRIFLTGQGQPYSGRADLNSPVPTPAGTIKHSYLVPQSMWPGVEALERRAPTLVVDFPGLKGFSGVQIREGLGRVWPGLKNATVGFPRKSGELHPEHLAWLLADGEVRKDLADSLAGLTEGAEYIGFPAVLGLRRPMEVIAHLEELTQRRVFEIPTLPPGLAGLRLRAAFGAGLASLGVKSLFGQLVFKAEPLGREGFKLHLGRGGPRQTVQTRSVVLATGRFLGQGLIADRRGIREPVFGLPVSQPEARGDLTALDFFSPFGHPFSRAGLATDGYLRPVDDSGRAAQDNLYAAGGILADHDWTRQKCGAGMSIATAYRAVRNLTRSLKDAGA